MAKLITNSKSKGVMASGQIGMSTEEFIKNAKDEGIEYKVTTIPTGKRGSTKSPTAVKKSKPERDETMNGIAKLLQDQGFEVKKGPKGLSYLNGKQWLTIAVTANRAKPGGLEDFVAEEEA